MSWLEAGAAAAAAGLAAPGLANAPNPPFPAAGDAEAAEFCGEAGTIPPKEFVPRFNPPKLDDTWKKRSKE